MENGELRIENYGVFEKLKVFWGMEEELNIKIRMKGSDEDFRKD
jgi:hypothetical protein